MLVSSSFLGRAPANREVPNLKLNRDKLFAVETCKLFVMAEEKGSIDFTGNVPNG